MILVSSVPAVVRSVGVRDVVRKKLHFSRVQHWEGLPVA